MLCRSAKKSILLQRDVALAPEAERSLRAHLAVCAACSVYARDLGTLGRWAAELPLAQPSESFDWRLRLALSRAERDAATLATVSPRLRRRAVLEFGGAAAVATAAVVVLGALLFTNGPQEPTQPVAMVRSVPGPERSDGRVIPVSDGAPIGPQLAPSYSYFMPTAVTSTDTSSAVPAPPLSTR
jgi:hypothetical protein